MSSRAEREALEEDLKMRLSADCELFRNAIIDAGILMGLVMPERVRRTSEFVARVKTLMEEHKTYGMILRSVGLVSSSVGGSPPLRSPTVFEPADPPSQEAAERAGEEGVLWAKEIREEKPPPPPRWRVGQKVGRTLYRDGQLVGMVDTREMASEIVMWMNRASSSATLTVEGESAASAQPVGGQAPPPQPGQATRDADPARAMVKCRACEYWSWSPEVTHAVGCEAAEKKT